MILKAFSKVNRR